MNIKAKLAAFAGLVGASVLPERVWTASDQTKPARRAFKGLSTRGLRPPNRFLPPVKMRMYLKSLRGPAARARAVGVPLPVYLRQAKDEAEQTPLYPRHSYRRRGEPRQSGYRPGVFCQ